MTNGVRVDPTAEAGEDKPRFVVHGRVVTMQSFGVIDEAAVYVHGGMIEEVRAARDPAPDGYAGAPMLDTRGTIYPGLIDLHNHLAYNALPPWPVARRYEDRSQWRRARDYAARVGIMHRLRTGNPARAVARYAEVKALLGGVTTMQGMRSSFGAVSSAMRGLVRNVEIGGEAMPRAGSSVQDLRARVRRRAGHDRRRRARRHHRAVRRGKAPGARARGREDRQP